MTVNIIFDDQFPLYNNNNNNANDDNNSNNNNENNNDYNNNNNDNNNDSDLQTLEFSICFEQIIVFIQIKC